MSVTRTKKVLPLLSIFLLFSCEKVELSSEVTKLIYAPTLEKAKEKVKGLIAENENLVFDEKDNELGRETYHLEVDRSGKKENYHYKRVDTYSGSFLVKDTKYDTDLNVEKRYVNVSYSENLYKVTITLEGYLDNKKEETIQKVGSTYTYQEGQFFEEVDNALFYTKKVSTYYQGGYYIADFFKTILSEYKSFTASDDTLTYEINQKEYKQNKETAIVDETLVMNDFGMVKSMKQSAKNTTTKKKNVSSLVVDYNLSA